MHPAEVLKPLQSRRPYNMRIGLVCEPAPTQVHSKLRPSDRLLILLFGSPRARVVWLTALAVGFVAFGVLVEIRSAFLKRRMTDFGVYARAAWALRAGADLYSITDENDWHYIYPPAFAILLAPLADPPPGMARNGFIPYALGVAVWYLLSVGLFAMTVDWIARIIEEVDPEPYDETVHGALATARSSLLRFVPFAVCLPHVGNTLARGQVGFLWLWMLAGAIVFCLRHRSYEAGVFLAGAICLKVIPAYLLLAPICRRDRRMLFGCAAGLCLGLILLPTVVLGPQSTIKTYQSFIGRVLAPGLGGGGDQTLASELTDVTSTRSQAPLCILHHWSHWDKERYLRPGQPSGWVRVAHWTFAIAATAIVVLIHRRRRTDKLRDLLLFANLTIAMILISPVCHMHYFLLALPLVMWLTATDGRFRARLMLRPRTLVVLGIFLVASILTLMPNSQRLQDSGILLLATLAMVGATAVIGSEYRRPARQHAALPAALQPA